MSKKAARLFLLLSDLTSCCHEREALQAERYGVTLAESRFLISMNQHNIKTTAEFAEKLMVAKSRITRIVDGLVKKGLAVRHEGKKDRRISVVRLTAKGKHISDDLFKSVISLHEEVLKTLPFGSSNQTLEELEALKSAMDSVRQRIKLQVEH